ncbi:MAG TPA: hypothetical protein VFA68_20775 [Terriglobales bacterium]|nr:hypothetical protein [Terriglobales bacterium]
MASEKAVYWIAICVMAAGLGNSWVNHHRDFARAVGQRVMIAADLVSGRAQGQLDRADALFARTQAGFDRGQATVDRVQASVDCLQARMARRQAALARAQAVRTRMAVAESMRKVMVTVPDIATKTVVIGDWNDGSVQ